MLSKEQIELVTTTVPVLREHGVALTSHFYKRMLSHNPELMQVFNMGHQRAGFQQQALAGAVLTYAENIENLKPLLGAVAHIANKHVSVGIRAEHYPIVGKHLIASIKEVLGEAATPELIDAWTAAYTQLADILIGAEKNIYDLLRSPNRQTMSLPSSWFRLTTARCLKLRPVSTSPFVSS